MRGKKLTAGRSPRWIPVFLGDIKNPSEGDVPVGSPMKRCLHCGSVCHCVRN